MSQLPPTPWYRSTWFIVLALVLLFPLGLYLMWSRRPGWGRTVNWIVTGVVVTVVTLISVASATAPPPKNIGGAVSAVTSPSAATTDVPTVEPSSAPTASATAPPTEPPTAPPTAAPTAPPTPRPTPVPTPPPTPPPTQPPPNTCGAPANPWGYNFCAGNAIYSPPLNFCDYFNCIPSFWKSTNGYVEECADATYSHSGGRSGACSSHGGELQELYGP